jgi:hypothetical protein
LANTATADAQWERSFRRLLAFIKREGHAKVPIKHIEDGMWLGAWAYRQRSKKRRGELSKQRIERLEGLPGWSWGKNIVPEPAPEKPPIMGGSEHNFIYTGFARDPTMIFTVLFGLGALPLEEAVRKAIEYYLLDELAPEKHFRKDGRSVWLVKRGIRAAIRMGLMDRPKRGYVRAIEADFKHYLLDDWVGCILRSLGDEPIQRDRAIRRASKWAAENMGLKFKIVRRGGGIYKKLDRAIDAAIKIGEVKKLENNSIVKDPTVNLETPSIIARYLNVKP